MLNQLPEQRSISKGTTTTKRYHYNQKVPLQPTSSKGTTTTKRYHNNQMVPYNQKVPLQPKGTTTTKWYQYNQKVPIQPKGTNTTKRYHNNQMVPYNQKVPIQPKGTTTTKRYHNNQMVPYNQKVPIQPKGTTTMNEFKILARWYAYPIYWARTKQVYSFSKTCILVINTCYFDFACKCRHLFLLKQLINTEAMQYKRWHNHERTWCLEVLKV